MFAELAVAAALVLAPAAPLAPSVDPTPHGELSCAGHRDQTDHVGLIPMDMFGLAIYHMHPTLGGVCPGSGLGLGDRVPRP